MPEVSATAWEAFLERFPRAHLLQSAAWGELKAAFGWQAARLICESPQGQMGAQLLFRPLPLGMSLAYLPKGPIGEGEDWESSHWRRFWHEVDELCRARRAIFLKVEPDIWQVADDQAPSPPAGFRASEHAVQPPRTLLVDLNGSEEALLGRMKQKTRYNIRLAQKRGVVVSPSADLALFYHLMVATGQRDGFGVHRAEYYQKAYDLFHPRGDCELFVAEYEGQPIGALMAFARGERAWYFYGASADVHREVMAPYLLQWEAMRWARRRGCLTYDLWGVPDEPLAVLEAQFAERRDGLWGVYRFKRGFGGRLVRALGPWDRVYRPALYALYRRYVAHRLTTG